MGTEILFVLVIVLLFFMLSRNRRRQQQQTARLSESLVPGARVMTTSGLHANVVEVRDTTVVLEIAPGLVTTWSRAAVSRAIDDDDATSPASTTQSAASASGASSSSATTPVAPAANDTSTTTVAGGPAAGSGASVSLHKTERPEL